MNKWNSIGYRNFSRKLGPLTLKVVYSSYSDSYKVTLFAGFDAVVSDSYKVTLFAGFDAVVSEMYEAYKMDVGETEKEFLTKMERIAKDTIKSWTKG